MEKAKSFLPGCISAAFIIAMLIFPAECAQGAAMGLAVFYKSILCVMLPFFILSSLILQTTAGFSGKAKKINRFNRLFDLPAHTLIAYLISLVCGYPSGARTACALCGGLSRRQRLTLFCLASNPGLLFCVSAIGEMFCSSKRAGILIYFSCLAGSFLAALLISRLNSADSGDAFKKTEGPSVILRGDDAFSELQPNGKSFSAELSAAVSSSVKTILNIGAFIVFFSVLRSLITVILGENLFSAVLCSVLELTCGAENLGKGYAQAPHLSVGLISALGSFGGVCVHFQSAEFVSEGNIKPYAYLFARLLAAFISFFVGIVLSRVFAQPFL